MTAIDPLIGSFSSDITGGDLLHDLRDLLDGSRQRYVRPSPAMQFIDVPADSLPGREVGAAVSVYAILRKCSEVKLDAEARLLRHTRAPAFDLNGFGDQVVLAYQLAKNVAA